MLTEAAETAFAATYRYDGDDLPDRDAAAKRYGFEAGFRHALAVIQELNDIHPNVTVEAIIHELGVQING